MHIDKFLDMTSKKITQYLSCKLPRKPEATEALLSLIWRKPKNDRAKWIITQLGNENLYK